MVIVKVGGFIGLVGFWYGVFCYFYGLLLISVMFVWWVRWLGSLWLFLVCLVGMGENLVCSSVL